MPGFSKEQAELHKKQPDKKQINIKKWVHVSQVYLYYSSIHDWEICEAEICEAEIEQDIYHHLRRMRIYFNEEKSRVIERKRDWDHLMTKNIKLIHERLCRFLFFETSDMTILCLFWPKGFEWIMPLSILAFNYLRETSSSL